MRKEAGGLELSTEPSIQYVNQYYLHRQHVSNVPENDGRLRLSERHASQVTAQRLLFGLNSRSTGNGFKELNQDFNIF